MSQRPQELLPVSRFKKDFSIPLALLLSGAPTLGVADLMLPVKTQATAGFTMIAIWSSTAPALTVGADGWSIRVGCHPIRCHVRKCLSSDREDECF